MQDADPLCSPLGPEMAQPPLQGQASGTSKGSLPTGVMPTMPIWAAPSMHRRVLLACQ